VELRRCMAMRIKALSVVGMILALGIVFGGIPTQGISQESEEKPPSGVILKPPGESTLQISIRMADEGDVPGERALPPGAYLIGEEVGPGQFIHLSLNQTAAVYLILIKPQEEFTFRQGGVTVTVRAQEVRLLFPNVYSPNNYLEPGEYTFPGPGLLDQSYQIPGPEGAAYVQAIATPFSIGLEPTQFDFNDPFPLLGMDPVTVKGRIEELILRRGLRPADWAADWTRFEMLETIPFTIVPPGTIIVKCLDADTRQPVNDAQVYLDFDRTVAYFCAEGVARIPNVSAGQHILRGEKNGYDPCQLDVVVLPGQTVQYECLLKRQDWYAELHSVTTQVHIGEEITFDACSSEGPILLYEWDFDSDGTLEKRTLDCQVTHTFIEAGTYLVTVYAVFEDATVDWADLRVTVIATAGCPPNPCRPGEFYISPDIKPSNPRPILGPGSLQLSFVEGSWVVFVLANTSYVRQRQIARVELGPSIAGKLALLRFRYRFLDLPEALRDRRSAVRMRALLRVAFFDKDGRCIGGTLTRGAIQFCQGIEAPLLDTDQEDPARWKQRREELAGEQEYQGRIAIPEDATSIIITAELEIPENDFEESITVKLEEVNLRP
jgi:hypothetical protein